jgi:hypothetical protein
MLGFSAPETTTSRSSKLQLLTTLQLQPWFTILKYLLSRNLNSHITKEIQLTPGYLGLPHRAMVFNSKYTIMKHKPGQARWVVDG